MTKRIVLSAFFFIVMILVIPAVQTMLFAGHTTGKMVIDKELVAPYLQGSEKEMMLVFFGYVGCVKVCTPILQELDKLYDSKEFAKNKGNVDLMFVNLMPELEPDQPDLFAKSFNPSFKGVYLTQKQLMSLDRELGVYFSKSIGDTAEIDHSDNLYLVKKQKDGTLILKSIYSMHPLKSEMLISDIEKMSKEKK
ncbi:electron transport protein SCO1/SenC [Sulfuricurvum kujiense DSM 16994]|uniref:Electron transport protein SCO1/SenC n=1 Tax=Sulfuricurvum kujiense (strain ATCC BAA-921 / DSM 16994 / JCM 11577 / YK-1) TaxID=709032 RepID=E4TZA0_SULKY|nr:SCO family protein [Sulfuricurvum kujiense]ADR34115.1 electron transport protein SCO1/SenC [Sulfuricurvum kujiense DSM 16994]